MSPAAFYVPLAEGRYLATAATAGPWSPGLQHGSPPAAMLARAIRLGLPLEGKRIGRIALDFFGPVPVGEVSVDVEAVRAGARIDLSRARMLAGGRVAMQASAWRIAVQPGRAPPSGQDGGVPTLPPTRVTQLFPDVPSFGYGEALEWRFVEGGFDRRGPSTVWTRPLAALVEGEETKPLERLLLMVDSANGISAELEPSRFTFVPVELTVAVHRHPQTEWVGMRARTVIDGDGIGLSRAELFDEEGYLGTATQTLFVAPR